MNVSRENVFLREGMKMEELKSGKVLKLIATQTSQGIYSKKGEVRKHKRNT